MVEAAEDVWVINVGEQQTRGIYRGVDVRIQQTDTTFDIYLDSVKTLSLELRSPVKAVTAAKATVDEMKSNQISF